MSQLKKRCLKHFKLISNEKLKFILEGNKPEDFHKTQGNTTQLQLKLNITPHNFLTYLQSNYH